MCKVCAAPVSFVSGIRAKGRVSPAQRGANLTQVCKPEEKKMDHDPEYDDKGNQIQEQYAVLERMKHRDRQDSLDKVMTVLAIIAVIIVAAMWVF